MLALQARRPEFKYSSPESKARFWPSVACNCNSCETQGQQYFWALLAASLAPGSVRDPVSKE